MRSRVGILLAFAAAPLACAYDWSFTDDGPSTAGPDGGKDVTTSDIAQSEDTSSQDSEPGAMKDAGNQTDAISDDGATTSCQQLVDDYANALPGARSCDVAQTGECATAVNSVLGCNCSTFVTVKGAGVLNEIVVQWN